ncbi:putative nuclease HARBI1 [Portunus trituberculatus]|uniref:putative nuclease HARBI1 n=1 Tax=Portunus trituberculatus TaxID=210409 RepID=UPI001E1CF79B|nr:putative nuclease HARBI1 [Portunus trituberculatus]
MWWHSGLGRSMTPGYEMSADFERGTIPGGCHLIGDSGYPCQLWLLTPVLQPRDASKEAYSRAHKRTRCRVERGIGQLKLKRRFHVLHGEIKVDPIKTSKIVMLRCNPLVLLAHQVYPHMTTPTTLSKSEV